LVMREVVPRTDVPCLILGVNAFGTAFATVQHQMRTEALAPLRDHLVRAYGPDHEVVYVSSASAWFEQAELHRLSLSALADDSAGPPGATLFVPAQGAPPETNVALRDAF